MYFFAWVNATYKKLPFLRCKIIFFLKKMESFLSHCVCRESFILCIIAFLSILNMQRHLKTSVYFQDAKKCQFVSHVVSVESFILSAFPVFDCTVQVKSQEKQRQIFKLACELCWAPAEAQLVLRWGPFGLGLNWLFSPEVPGLSAQQHRAFGFPASSVRNPAARASQGVVEMSLTFLFFSETDLKSRISV